MRLAKSDWKYTSFDSIRWSKHYAFLPVKTIDCGWVWLGTFWMEEQVWGWDFHDKFRYGTRPAGVTI